MKFNRRAQEYSAPSRSIRMRPAPDPCSLDAPSVYGFHMSVLAQRFSGALVYVSFCSSILSPSTKVSSRPYVFTCVGLSVIIVSTRKSRSAYVMDQGLSSISSTNRTTLTASLAADRYGYIKNHMKTVKNKQARTRESEEYQKKPKNQSRSQKSQASVKISQEKSKSVKDVFPRDSLAQDQAQATSIMEKAQIYVGFTLNSLTKEAQAVTSRNDSLAILKCT
ncbi:hypothetical protein Tco_1221464 [Tanacetum coccineum]